MAASEGSHAEDPEIDAPERLGRVPTLGDLIAARLSRRDALKGLAVAALAATGSVGGASDSAGEAVVGSSLTFTEIEHGLDDKLHVAPGYQAQVLIRWGDPVVAGAPAFDVRAQTAAAQEQQFGYNNDFLAYLPLPRGSDNSEHGLLCANHEYTLASLMFPTSPTRSREEIEVEMAAHGHTVLEVRKTAGTWQVVPNSRYARRITGRSTPMNVSGPAAGHERLRTTADPSGRRVIGTLNNCAGGMTPWGTVLVAEENFDIYFRGNGSHADEAVNFKRYGVGTATYHNWHLVDPRFDLSKDPHEPNRFGWVVEYDPYDRQSTPVKRTALGRVKHEGAMTTVAPNGRVVVYCGDDSKFEYLYKFVSAKAWNPRDRAANQNLLDDGTLYVARLAADGNLAWLPLTYGTGPLNAAHGFRSQADVLIETRRAADLLGATPLDRPEDVEINPVTGRVYVMLTNNVDRKATDVGSPRVANKHGHVLELLPPGPDGQRDHTAEQCQWDIFLQGGNPAVPADGAKYNVGVSANGWLSCPDNGAFDARGRLWIATDGAPASSKMADGVYGCETTGPARALPRLFFRAPTGAETTGPCFTPDGSTLFVSVQHPGDDAGSTFEQPSTRWPDFQADMPPRPSVVAITRVGGGEIGGA